MPVDLGMKTFTVESGEPFDIPKHGHHTTICCDCGLAHLERVEKTEKGFTITVWRDNFETLRQHKLKRKKKKK